jgi:hypothetical protein
MTASAMSRTGRARGDEGGGTELPEDIEPVGCGEAPWACGRSLGLRWFLNILYTRVRTVAKPFSPPFERT